VVDISFFVTVQEASGASMTLGNTVERDMCSATHVRCDSTPNPFLAAKALAEAIFFTSLKISLST
jgi:hypothetical protein